MTLEADYQRALADVSGRPVARAVVLRVFCAACGDSPTLATVRRHRTRGLFYLADIPSGVQRTNTHRRREAMSKQPARRRIAATVGRQVLLLDAPDHLLQPDLPPQAECKRHGVADLDWNDLRTRALAASRVGAAAGVVTIH